MAHIEFIHSHVEQFVGIVKNKTLRCRQASFICVRALPAW
jgi:hypothetical protein